MVAAVVEDLPVDLICEDKRFRCLYGFGDRRHVLTRQYRPAGIVGRVQYNELGAGRN